MDNSALNKIDLKTIPINEAEFVILDFETTGTSAKHGRAIEVGLVHLKNSKIVDTYQSFINPGMGIPYSISLLTGITNDDVYDAPFFEDIVSDIKEFIGDKTLTAHNLRFDRAFLNAEFARCGEELNIANTLCTLQLARKLYPELPSKSLGNVVKFMKIKHVNVHRALGDASVTAKILVKMLDELKEGYHIEYLDELFNFVSLPKQRGYKILKKKLASDYTSLPDSPGVYFFKDANEKIIYVGKAKSLKGRVKNYFSSTAISKSKKIVRAASRLNFRETNSELTALLTESELIKKYKPRYNSLLKKYGNSYFLKVDKTKSFPKVTSTSKFDFDGNDYFGPFARHDTVKEIQEIIDKSFLLRECTEKEFEKGKKCYLADIERCLAPCIKKNITKEYEAELEKVYDFVEGKNDQALQRLIEKMKSYSEQQKFEEAAVTRDTINLLLSQIKRVSFIAEPINAANVLFVVSEGLKKDYALMQEGKLYIKDYDLDAKDLFDTALHDYYDGTIPLYKNSEEKDLDRIKVVLAWLSNNMEKVKSYYLSDYNSVEELFNQLNQ